MNMYRVVAALAAVAVGFGITLVGVAVADDPSSTPIPSTTEPASPIDSGGVDPTTADTVDSDAIATEAVATEPAPKVPASGATASEFPCSDASFEVLVAELSDQAQTELITDTDLFVRVIANRLARAGTRPADDWEDSLHRVFDAFTTAGCAATDEQVFGQRSAPRFYCSAARMSSDDRLFVFFQTAARDQMTGCSFERPQGEN